jgi:hypothetical protein
LPPPGWTAVDGGTLEVQTYVLGADGTAGRSATALFIGLVVIVAGALSAALILGARALHGRRHAGTSAIS